VLKFIRYLLGIKIMILFSTKNYLFIYY